MCPVCKHTSETAEFVKGFDCDKCGEELVIINGNPKIKNEPEIGE